MLLVAPVSACAQQTPDTTHARPVAMVTTGGADTGSEATPASFNSVVAPSPEPEMVSISPAEEPLIGESVSRRDAFRASTDQIIYHVGEGMRGIEAQVLSLQNDGYRISAFYGGKPGQVECFVARLPCGEYNQDQVFDATMSGTASILYDERIGEPSTQPTSVAALNR